MCHDVNFTARFQLLEDYIPELETDSEVYEVLEGGTNGYAQAQAHQKVPVIIFEDGRYKTKIFAWGIIAPYMNTPEKIKTMRSSMVNARAEKIVGEKASFWHQIRNNRCIFPVEGIYEHRAIDGWKSKVPYFIQVKDRPVFGIPGLYHYPHIADKETGEIRGTFAIITRAANPLMRQIHNSGANCFRMPLFLPKDLEQKWLQPNLDESEIAEVLQYEMPAEQLPHHPVYTIRGPKQRPDGKDRSEPYAWPQLPPLGQDSNTLSLFG